MQYSPFLFDESDIEFLQALREFLAQPSKDTYAVLKDFNIQHREDLLCILYRNTIYARKDYIAITLRREKEIGILGERELVITKSSLKGGYCCFIANERLYPSLKIWHSEEAAKYCYYTLQGNLYIDIARKKQIEATDYIPIKYKTLHIGRHTVYLECKEGILLMRRDSSEYEFQGTLLLTVTHPEHGTDYYILNTADKAARFHFHTRHDLHVHEQLAKKLYQALP